jgi:glycerophosphoryl diester phosphodiesterase
MKHLLVVLSICLSLVAEPKAKWIAHRGGVVDAAFAENSPASLEAAVKRGYWMIEADIRETLDRKIITHHDVDFQRFYGDARRVVDLPLEEIRKLRSEPGNSPPMLFRELVALCRGRLRLMLDVKEPEHDEAFYAEMERELQQADLLDSALLIGLDSARRYFHGKMKVSVNSRQLREAVRRGEAVSALYFLFEWGRHLSPLQIEFARKHKVEIVPSVNLFHYGEDRATSLRGGEADIRRLRKLGVRNFQIDSAYEGAFR